MHFSKRIVLIANVKKIPNKGYRRHMSSLDLTKRFTNMSLAWAIKKIGYKLVEYNNIDIFLKNIDSHRDDLIFPYYLGVASKIRQSYIQTICECMNLKYVGGDAYSQTIGNDKALSKEICRYAGIQTPAFKILFDPNYLPDLSNLNFPVIVKPQFEGDSIGISDMNVIYNSEDVFPFATSLFNDLNQPILIEEFKKGREISICIVGYRRKIKKLYILENINKKALVSSYGDKKFKPKLKKYIQPKELLTNDLIENVTSLFQSLDKLEYIRLDFIYSEGVLFNIELTADADLSPLSSMHRAFMDEMSYPQFVEFLIDNCLERYDYITTL